MLDLLVHWLLQTIAMNKNMTISMTGGQGSQNWPTFTVPLKVTGNKHLWPEKDWCNFQIAAHPWPLVCGVRGLWIFSHKWTELQIKQKQLNAFTAFARCSCDYKMVRIKRMWNSKLCCVKSHRNRGSNPFPVKHYHTVCSYQNGFVPFILSDRALPSRTNN